MRSSTAGSAFNMGLDVDWQKDRPNWRRQQPSLPEQMTPIISLAVHRHRGDNLKLLSLH